MVDALGHRTDQHSTGVGYAGESRGGWEKAMTAATPNRPIDERLSDEDVRARHRNDRDGMARTEAVLDEVRDGTASEVGISGEELRDFLRERT